MGTHPIFESDFDCLTECLLVKSSTPPGLSSTPQSQLTALLVLTPLPSTPPPRRVVTRLASRLISRTLLVLSTPSPRSLTFSATHASALARRSPPFPPLLARLTWPRPLLVFFEALCENNRMGLFSEVAEVYARILQAEAGEVPVEIASAIELTSEQKSEVAEAVASMLGNQTPVISSSVDSSLLGGMTVALGDKYTDMKFVDMSVANKVKKYTDLLRANA